MKVSIITPTWNRATTLARTIQSIESQTLIPCRHVIVDNLSEDGTEDLVKAYQQRAPYDVVHIRESDSGIYDAMNKGARIAGGDALYFLNDDDHLLNPDSLQLLAKSLSLEPSGVAFADVLVHNPATGTSKIRNHRQVNRLTLAEKSICQQATIYSRQAIETVGPFDASLKAAGDYDWMLRALLQHGTPAVYLRHPVAVFTEGGISSDPARRTEFESEMADVAGRYFSLEVRARALRYRQFWRKIPFGLNFCPGAKKTDRLKVTSRILFCGRISLDPLAIIDL